MKNIRSNILLALLFSLLTSLVGGVVFGLIYATGYFIYYLTTLELILTCTVFLKFTNSKKWSTVLFAVIWSVIWTFIFNFLSIIVCEASSMASEFNLTFTQAFTWLIELWKTEPDITTYMNERMSQVIIMIVLGGFIYSVAYVASAIKLKKSNSNNSNATSNNVNKNKENSSKEILKQTYLNIIESCRNAYRIYSLDKNKETFKTSLNKIEEFYIIKLKPEEKNIIKSNLEKKINKEDSSNEDKTIAKIILTLFK